MVQPATANGTANNILRITAIYTLSVKHIIK